MFLLDSIVLDQYIGWVFSWQNSLILECAPSGEYWGAQSPFFTAILACGIVMAPQERKEETSPTQLIH